MSVKEHRPIVVRKSRIVDGVWLVGVMYHGLQWFDTWTDAMLYADAWAHNGAQPRG